MIYIATNKDNRDALMHYGVPGMRWRNRRGPQPLAPGTPTLSLPQRTHRIDPRPSASTRHRTIFPTGHARVQVGDQPKTYNPKPPIPKRNTSRNSLTRGGTGNPFDPRRTSTRRETGQNGSVQYRRISDSERQNMIDRRNRAVSKVQSNQNRKERPRDFQRRRYGR